MASDACYRIVETYARGKIVLATRDILAGEIVVNDPEPILTFSAEFLKLFLATSPREVALALAAYSTYLNVLTPEKKEKFATLFGPTTGGFVENLRTYAMQNKVISEGDQLRSLTPDEVETFVRVANVLRLNVFDDDGDLFYVYSEATRLAHSCASNCRFSFEGPACICSATRRIKQGEELTISYLSERDLQPTHLRRQKYLTKEFTCHCPRCDAPGDDTRQFDCFDPACKGVLIACQPVNQKIVAPGLLYSGVEYVKPHLLPCTECHRTPPVTYQTEMFALEATLESQAWTISEQFEALMERRHYADMEVLLREIRKFPRRHILCWPILLVKLKILDKLSTYRGTVTRMHLALALRDYVAVQESVFPHPNLTVCSNILAVCIMFCSCYTLNPVFPPQQEKELWQKGLRMYLILHGRESREPNSDTLLPGVLEKLPPVLTSELCAFCEESPARAAMKRTRCGLCKKVVYCSMGCQKAHWKLHKTTCKLK